MQIAVALAIVSVFAVAMMAGGEALSFNSGDFHVVNDAPPNQSQPQDFAGAGSQFYHFGADYMCQLYTNFTIECFGSDEHGIVSDVPTVTGFTNIDGGDTYACAFNEIVGFNYCWGAITRNPTTSPPTAQPTVAPTVQPTVEPTATVAPAGTVVPTETPAATPVATATAVATATVVPTQTPTATPANPCELVLPSSTLPVTMTGSWSDECVYPIDVPDAEDGDRYYQWVEFVASSGGVPWTATLTSNEDTYMLLWETDVITDEFRLVDENDDIAQGNTNSQITWTPVQGNKYLIDATTYNANTLGDFTLTIREGTAGSQGSSIEQRIEQFDRTDATPPLERRQ